MPRPTNKQLLLEQMQKEHLSLSTRIIQLSEENIVFHNSTIGYSAKDVLAHITAWEQLCLSWYHAGVNGETPHLPHEGYNWRQIPELNAMFYRRDKDKPLAQVLKDFQQSYEEILATVQQIDEKEMFTPQVYSWTNQNAMGTYFVSATCSHYVWAQKEIKKCLKDFPG